MSGVRDILGFSRTVTDLATTEAFYSDGLGFVRAAPPGPMPAAEAEAMGLPPGTPQLVMRLGAQAVTFLAPDPPGAPYPAEPRSTDPFFQHLAIPVRDTIAAMAHLSRMHPTPISQGGAQTLPASSGGVSAWKFRDPDGHPLELIHFPDGDAAARWRDAAGLFLGIDHSAVTVTDLDAALGFLTGLLGLRIAQRGLNHGPEQARLDGVDGPEVDVVALEPPDPAPHVEVLHYRAPARRRPAPGLFGPRDRASTRFVFRVADPDALALRLVGAGWAARASADRAAAYATGPDGHGLLFVRRD